MISLNHQENLWGYRKRLFFIRQTLVDAFGVSRFTSLRVLDVGCGNGSQLALPLARQGLHITGIDPNATSITNAREKAEDLLNAKFLCISVEDISEYFDVVILSEVLEHVANPQDLLFKATSRLTRGGVAIVTTPNGYGEFELDRWLFDTFRLQRLVEVISSRNRKALASTDNDESPHIQFFTRRRLYNIFAQCGLEVWREAGSTLFSGPIIGHSLARSQRFVDWNAKITDRLPLAVASGWYFALRHKEQPGIAS